MKRILNLITAILCIFVSLFSQNLKEINLSFDRKDFVIEPNEENEGFITFKNIDFTYDEDPSLPCIPFLMVNVVIPGDMEYSSVEMRDQKTLDSINIILANNPEISSTNMMYAKTQNASSKYDGHIHPHKRIEFVCSNDFETFSILVFRVTPFEYNSEMRELYFSDRMTLSIRLTESDKIRRTRNSKRTVESDCIKRFVVNPGDMDSVTSQRHSAISNSVLDHVDYVIITSSELKSAFEPLVEWKNTKGIRTKVVTTEYIDEHYSGSTMQLKIKECLYDYYQNNELQYALLGGDDTVVPVMECHAYANSNYDITDMPTDLFYACFNGTFDWNQDNDNIYGEITDGVNLFPSIYVTRVPVRTYSDIKAFVDKILVYEKTPTLHGWNNQILMCGSKMGDRLLSSGQSEAEAQGNTLYDDYFDWDGSRMRFYDTFTDFPNGASYDLTTTNLQNQIAKGYSFIDMITHGGHKLWKMEPDNMFYSNIDGASSFGTQPTVVTTMSCLTNAFDHWDDPCLSESFIRNPNNGIIAYLGCSREGWFYQNSSLLGTSLKYEAQFYQELFSGDEFKNFGKVVAIAKYTQQSISYRLGTPRWVMFGLNPIGDAEMPIYTSVPVEFSDVSIICHGNSISVDAGVYDTRICVMSAHDMGASYYDVRENVEEAFFDGINTDVTICITKHNHIPYIATISLAYIQNETILGPRIIEADAVIIGSNVTSTKPYGPVQIKGSDITVKSGIIRIEDGTTIDANVNITLKNN